MHINTLNERGLIKKFSFHVSHQDETYDNQNQHYQQQNLEQYTPDGQSERYADGQEYQEQQQQQQQQQLEPQQQNIDNVDQNYDAMYQQYTTPDPNYNQDEYEYPQESHPPTEQYSSNAYYSEQPGENYYSDVNQMPANTLNLSSNNVQNSYMKSDAVNEITRPPTLTNVPVKHANDSQYENKYAPDGGEESSSTTYSENVNIPQQIFTGAVENVLPVGVQGNIIGNAESRANVPPNYLESETDESSAAQQVKEMVNDESDFDFSAN